MKTQNDILTDVYNLIKTTEIGSLSGEIYKNTRLMGSSLEDCVISLLNGVSGKHVQWGALLVKIFYKDITNGSTISEDSSNGHTKQLLLFNLSEALFGMYGYNFFYESREIYIGAVPDISQHYALLKINFKLI